MADMTDAVREALGGVTYGVREAPLLDTPQDDSPTVDTLVTDPVHCTARHLHHDFQSVVTSMMSGLIGQVPDNTFRGTFTHIHKPPNIPAEGPRGEDWGYRETIEEAHKQGAMLMAMAGWMAMVKMVEDAKNNYVYIEKRWKAAVTSLGLTDKVCTSSKKDLVLAISDAVNRNREVKSKFIRTFISLESNGGLPVDPVRAAVLGQVKMVWEYHGMCLYRLMDQNIFTDSPVLGIEAIAREACAFRKHYSSLQEKMGVHFPYTGVLGLVPADLTISKYPNLYLVSISHAKSRGSLANFQQSTNVKASVPVKVLAKAVKGMTDSTVVSEGALRELSTLGLVTAEGRELQRRTRGLLTRKKRRDTDSEDEEDAETDQAGPSRKRR